MNVNDIWMFEMKNLVSGMPGTVIVHVGTYNSEAVAICSPSSRVWRSTH